MTKQLIKIDIKTIETLVGLTNELLDFMEEVHKKCDLYSDKCSVQRYIHTNYEHSIPLRARDFLEDNWLLVDDLEAQAKFDTGGLEWKH